MTMLMQRSFVGGEVSRTLDVRVDQNRVVNGVERAHNTLVRRDGSMTRRPGLEFVQQAKYDDRPCALLAFEFDENDTYLIEIGDGYCRFYSLGERESVSSIAAWVTATAYSQGDVKSNGGSNWYCILDHTSAAANEPGVGASHLDYWYELTANILEVPLPYSDDEVCGNNGEVPLHYEQSNDVVFMTHPNHPPAALKRLGPETWVYESPLDLEPPIAAPTNVVLTPQNGAGSGTQTRRYQVTAVDRESGRESLPALGDYLDTTTFATVAVGVETTLTITGGGTPPDEGDLIRVDSGATPNPLYAGDWRSELIALIGQGEYLVTDVTGNDVTIDLDSSEIDLGASPSTLTIQVNLHLAYNVINNIDQNIDGNEYISVEFDNVPGARQYNVYLDDRDARACGFIGDTRTTEFKDDGIAPAYEETAPLWQNPFRREGYWPATVAFQSERLAFGGSNEEPASTWMSRTGDFRNFTNRIPLRADDAFKATIAGGGIRIRSLRSISQALVALTTRGEYAIRGRGDDDLSPDNVDIDRDGDNGASPIAPLIANRSVLYVQRSRSRVYDLAFDLSAEGYVGEDLTTYAAHLVDGYRIVDWAFARSPDSIVYAIRDDGAMLALTYVREQNIVAWTRLTTKGLEAHGTDGSGGYDPQANQFSAQENFESVATVVEGADDVVYVVVKRVIGATTRRYIERLAVSGATLTENDIRDTARYADSHFYFDGLNTGSTTISATEYLGGGWEAGATVTLTASASEFSTTDVTEGRGRRLAMVDNFGKVIEFEVIIDTFVSATEVRGTLQNIRYDGELVTTVDDAAYGTPTASWVLMVTRLTSGVSHLNTENVAVLLDGVPVYGLKVSSGTITFPSAAGKVLVGLPIECSVKLLPFDAVSDSTIVDRIKPSPYVDLFVHQTRGVRAGPTDDTLTAAVDPDDPLGFAERRQRIQIVNINDREVPIVISAPEPLPMTLRGVGRVVEISRERQ